MGSIHSVLNYAWILDPMNNVVIIFRGLEKEGPTSVSLGVFIIIFDSLPGD